MSIHRIEAKLVKLIKDLSTHPVFDEQTNIPTEIQDGNDTEENTLSVDNDQLESNADNEPLFHIYVSEDRINAFLIVRQTGVELSEVTQELEKKSISQNLDIGNIYQELKEPTCKHVLIAHGVPPIPGEDGRLDLFFTEKLERNFMEIDGLIDYRNSLKIPSVQKGEVIAKKIQPTEGVVGYDVYRQLIIPPKPQDMIIVAREHVEQREDGFMIAMKEGRPRITGGATKFLDISTAYVVSGDVNIATGNIVFSGDVFIYGNVTEHMIIESLGNIYVVGSVYNATLTATGSILIKGNAIKSKLYSGHFGVVFNRIYNGSRALAKQLEQLIEASKILMDKMGNNIQNVTYGQIVTLLVENKFKEIPQFVRSLLSYMHSVPSQDKEVWQRLINKLEQYVHLPLATQEITNDTLLSLVSDLQETSEKIGHMKESDVNIDIGQCYLSTLKSHGDILIRKEGVLQSDLFSAANIIFYQDDAVCRGSRLEADGTISAAIVGGQTSSVSHLKAKRKIMVRTLYSGRVCVENYCVDLFDPIENVTIDKAWIMKRLRTS
jgi:uncharacterized protein (DUF342 family)